MATERELKTIYEGIELGEEETTRYRRELAARMSREVPCPSFRPYIWAATLAAVLVVAFLIWPRESLNNEDLESLKQRLERDRMATLDLALDNISKDGLAGLNARLILCMTSDEQTAIDYAVTGLRTDPRPTFRRYYLERLLDADDSIIYDRQTIQALIDNETDPYCIDLFMHLLTRVV